MKAFIEGSTGNGKTAICINFAVDYRINNPNNEIYSNLPINISKTIYTPLGYIPFSEMKKGNKMIILDDFGNLDNTKSYSVYLATICRKTNTQMLLTCQYAKTQIQKSLREMCEYCIKPFTTNKIYNSEKGKYFMTNESKIIYKTYKTVEPLNDVPISVKVIHNPLEVIQDLYNTSELVEIPNERLIKQEILRFSKTIRDIELNVCIYTKNRTIQKRLMKELIEQSRFTK